MKTALAGAATLTCGRERNEDYALAAQTGNGLLLAVADGLGGHPKGAQASEAACRALPRELGRLEGVDETSLGRLFGRLDAAVAKTGGGTTLVLALVQGNEAWFAHVGDSRAYLIRAGRMLQLTRDHSVVEALFEEGRITEEEMAAHPLRNVVSRALGTGGTALREHNRAHVPAELRGAAPEVQHLSLRRGDILVLVSDGVSGLLTPARMLSLVESEGDAKRAARALAQEADRAGKARGGNHDNATALVYFHTGPKPRLEGKPIG